MIFDSGEKPRPVAVCRHPESPALLVGDGFPIFAQLAREAEITGYWSACTLLPRSLAAQRPHPRGRIGPREHERDHEHERDRDTPLRDHAPHLTPPRRTEPDSDRRNPRISMRHEPLTRRLSSVSTKPAARAKLRTRFRVDNIVPSFKQALCVTIARDQLRSEVIPAKTSRRSHFPAMSICTSWPFGIFAAHISFLQHKKGSDAMVPKLIVEFIGTFFLVFTVGPDCEEPGYARRLRRWRSGRRSW